MNESAAKGKASTTYPQRWIRLPKKGVDPDTGLTRPAFYQLIAQGRIRTVSLRRPGTLRGARLVWLPSVLALLDSLADQQHQS